MKIIKFFALTVTVMLFFLVSVCYVFLSTNTGTKRLLQTLAYIVPGNLTYGEVNGKLNSAITVNNVFFRNEDLTVSIKSLTVGIKPSELLKKKLFIQFLKINALYVEYKSAATNNDGSFDVNSLLPIFKYVDLKHAVINDSSFTYNQAVYKLNYAAFHDKFIQCDLQSKYLSLLISGTVNPYWKINFQLMVPELNTIDANYKGDLLIVGKVNVLYGYPHLTASFKSKKFSHPEFIITNLSGQAKSVGIDKVEVEAPNLHIALPNVPTLKNISADVKGLLTVHDFMASREIMADFMLNNGNISIPDLGMTIKQIKVNGKYRKNIPLNLQGSFAIGNGSGSFTTKINLDNFQAPIQTHIVGKNLNILNLKEYKANISPDLLITYTDKSTTINGNVLIPFGSIKAATVNNFITLPSDVVFQKQTSVNHYWLNDLSGKVTLVVGEAVNLRYAALSTQLGGSVSILKRQNSPFIGSGVIYTINGTYAAYGRKLNINTGKLIYAGNELTNPGLDIQATQHFKYARPASDNDNFISSDKDIKVGVAVRGSVKKPIVSLTSDPAGLSREDILSYLLFGYPRANISTSNGLMLLNTALASTEGSKNHFSQIMNKISSRLGLSEVGLESIDYYNANTNQNDSATSIGVKKDINKNLSLHYSFGIFQSMSILTAKLKVHKYFYLQAETNPLENGADFMYEIEA